MCNVCCAVHLYDHHRTIPNDYIVFAGHGHFVNALLHSLCMCVTHVTCFAPTIYCVRSLIVYRALESSPNTLAVVITHINKPTHSKLCRINECDTSIMIPSVRHVRLVLLRPFV